MKSSDSKDTVSDTHAAIAKHLPSLRRFARALTGSQEDGDGHAARALEALIADRGRLDAALSPRLGLFRLFHEEWIASGRSTPARKDALPEIETAAQRRLSQLSPTAREVFLLAGLEEFSDDEVAAILSVPAQEVRRLQQDALRRIRQQTAARVLIVEDEPVIAMDIESIIRGMGHDSVGIVDTHGQAVSMTEQEKPDLILSDIQLSDNTSGIDAARDILAKFDIPIIFITAFPERLLTGERPEPTFLITKPFKRSVLETAVSQALFFGSADAIRL